MERTDTVPAGTEAIPGIVHRRSPHSVDETVTRLCERIGSAGATVFCRIDQRREAEAVGLALRDTTLVVFGNPALGTPPMAAVPAVALDLPLKILVWTDDDGVTWMTYLSAEWLADRYGLSDALARPLRATDALTSQLSALS